MFLSCENAFTGATVTARFDGGQEKELLTQAKHRGNAAKYWAIRKLTMFRLEGR